MTLDELEMEGPGGLLGGLALGQGELGSSEGDQGSVGDDGGYEAEMSSFGGRGEARGTVPNTSKTLGSVSPPESEIAETPTDSAVNGSSELDTYRASSSDSANTEVLQPVNDEAHPTTPSSSSSSTTPPSRTGLYAQVSSVVRTYLLDQSRKLDQTEEMSLSQERKREVQQKKKERADKWAKKNPGTAKGLAGGGFGSKMGAKRDSKSRPGRGR